MSKNADAFRTISEVAEELALPQHVLRFWESRFPQIRPLKRAGGRRYYRPGDIALLRSIQALLYDEGYTIKGVQRLLKEQGAKGIAAGSAADIPIDEPDERPDEGGEENEAAVVHDPAPVENREADATSWADEAPGAGALVPYQGHAQMAVVPVPVTMAPMRAPPPAGLLGSLQRDALETALLVLDDCERVLAPLRRRQS